MYYHITSLAAAKRILKQGLKGNHEAKIGGVVFPEKRIWVLTHGNDSLCGFVALNQIWIDENVGSVAILKISNKGITGKVLKDEVAERTAAYHRLIIQDKIEPQHIKMHKVMCLDYPGKMLAKIRDAAFTRKLSRKELTILSGFADSGFLEFVRQYQADKFGLAIK